LLRVGLLLSGLVVPGIVPFHAGAAPAEAAPSAPAAVTASPQPLPTVNYPFQLPNVNGPAAGPTVSVPDTSYYGGTTQYAWVDGVWGYWDRGHVFHPAARTAAVGARGIEPRRTPVYRPAVGRSVVHLPNAGSGRIVTGQATAGGRGHGR
jgi:hypothetical protein